LIHSFIQIDIILQHLSHPLDMQTHFPDHRYKAQRFLAWTEKEGGDDDESQAFQVRILAFLNRTSSNDLIGTWYIRTDRRLPWPPIICHIQCSHSFIYPFITQGFVFRIIQLERRL
jgi:hypothetical protein